MLEKISFSFLQFVRITRCFKGNLLTSLSLTAVSVLIYMIFCLVFEIALFIICQILTNYNYVSYSMMLETNSIYFNFFGLILFIAPFNLSVKNWYYNLNEECNTNVLEAFVIFSSFRYYFKSLCFCTVKIISLMMNFIATMLPFTIIYSVFRVMIITNEYSDAITAVVLFISILLLFCGLLSFFISYIKYVVVDFVFLSRKYTKNHFVNYFKLMKISKEIIKQNNLNLIKIITYLQE